MLEQATTTYANGLLARHGLKQLGWQFKLTNSAKFFGATFYKSKTIYLSRPYMAVNTRQTIAHALRHELAHALVPFSKNHPKTWHAACIKLGGNGNAHLTNEVRP